MATGLVPGFLPSLQGFRFANRWPAHRAWVRLGPLKLAIGNSARGLCGGMAFAARDRFERGEAGDAVLAAPGPGDPLFEEIIERQNASFGTWFVVPLRFWLASAGSQAARDRETARSAWPALKREIDAGRPAMVGLVRRSGSNPLVLGLGHQVVAYRYEETPTRVTVWIYDPNYPGDDDAAVWFERAPSGGLRYGQRPSEPLIGLLALPFTEPRAAR
jgi:hypothetical protein